MQPEQKNVEPRTVRRIREIWFVVDDTYDLRHFLNGHDPEMQEDKSRYAAFREYRDEQSVDWARPLFADNLLHETERVALNIKPRSDDSDKELGRALRPARPLDPRDPNVQRFAARLEEASRSEGLRMIRRLRKTLPPLHPFYRLRLVEEQQVGGAQDQRKERQRRPDPVSMLRQLPGIRAAYDIPGARWDAPPLNPSDPWFSPPSPLRFAINGQLSPKLRDQWNVRLINTLPAWQFATGSGVLVGIIDSGVQAGHSDLEDVLDPRSDAVLLDRPGKPGEKDPHGTLVAGIIAAQVNDEGICGIAPDAKILSLVYGEPDPPERRGKRFPAPEPGDWIAAIVRAAREEAQVINCSWHLEVPCCRDREVDQVMEGLRNAVWTATTLGSTVVCSMGNRSQYNEPAPYESWPAALNGTTYAGTELVVIGVGGVGYPLPGRELGRFWDSNYGPEMLVMAPGHEAPSTDLMGTDGYNRVDTAGTSLQGWFNNYAPFGGTSAAAAHVTGVVALMLSVNKSLTPAEVRDHLAKTAVPIGTLLTSGADRDDEYGHGLVNAGAAARVAAVRAFNKLIPLLPGFDNDDEQMAQLLLDRFISHSTMGQAFAGKLMQVSDELETIFASRPDIADDIREALEELYPLLKQLIGVPTFSGRTGRLAYRVPIARIYRLLDGLRISAELQQALRDFRRAGRQVLFSQEKLVDAIGGDDALRGRRRWTPQIR